MGYTKEFHGEATFLENIREYKQQSGIITSVEG